jgi:hypothetical protein
MVIASSTPRAVPDGQAATRPAAAVMVATDA